MQRGKLARSSRNTRDERKKDVSGRERKKVLFIHASLNHDRKDRKGCMHGNKFGNKIVKAKYCRFYSTSCGPILTLAHFPILCWISFFFFCLGTVDAWRQWWKDGKGLKFLQLRKSSPLLPPFPNAFPEVPCLLPPSLPSFFSSCCYSSSLRMQKWRLLLSGSQKYLLLVTLNYLGLFQKLALQNLNPYFYFLCIISPLVEEH